MKIIIKEDKKRFNIVLPNLLIFSGLSSRILKKASKKQGGASLRISPAAMRKIRRCIREMRRIHQNWYLVDLIDANGSSIKIKL